MAKTPKTPKTETETPTVSSQASDVVVDGLAETTKTAQIAKLRELQTAKKAKGRAASKIAERVARLRDFAAGTNESSKNPKLHHNPALLPDTLRSANEGEQINGLPAKGWVVTIRCLVCDTEREINTQDAFQVRFCEEHKAEAQKTASKARRSAKKDAELAKLDPAELDAQIAALEADLAA